VIFRVKHRQNFVVIHNQSVRDPNLSLKATGLLAFLLSFPDKMTFTRETIAKMKPDGVASIRAGLKELAREGYLTYAREQGKDGRWTTSVVVQETPNSPKADFQPSVFDFHTSPKAGFPTAENPPLKEERPKEEIPAPPLFAPDGAAAPDQPPAPPVLVSMVTDLPQRVAALKQELHERGAS
jgi:hypothetical protein